MLATQSTYATYAQLVPFSELAPGQAAKIRSDLISGIIAMATTQLKLDPSKLVVRDVRAKDDLTLYTAGSASGVEDWGCVTAATANAYENLATGTMGDQRWIGIYGVKINPGCACTALKFHIGGGDRVIWQLQGLREEDNMVGLCPAGVVIPQNSPYTISRFVRLGSSPAYIVLKGVVIEPRGRVISP